MDDAQPHRVEDQLKPVHSNLSYDTILDYENVTCAAGWPDVSGPVGEDQPKLIRLPDGRRLGWHEYGDALGAPCVFLPGAGASGLAGAALHDPAASRGIRLISLDRPGLGHSDPVPPRRLADWAKDVEELMDQLGLGLVGLLAHSAGGPYALAVAHLVPGRVSCVVIGAGSPPYSESWTRSTAVASRMSRLYGQLAMNAPRLCGALYHLTTPRSTRAVERIVRLASRGSSEDAQFARDHPEATRVSLIALWDGSRQGPSGPVDDIAAVARPWGFGLHEVTTPVEWWHGLQDKRVSPQAGREVTTRLPCATAHFVDGGHYALFARAEEALAPLGR